MRRILSLFLLSPLLLSATDYTFVDLNSPWHFGAEFEMDPKGRPWHIETSGTWIGKGDLRHHDGGISLANAFASVYYSQFLSPQHALSWQVGYTFQRFDFEKNPRFEQKDFHYGLVSLAYITHGVEDWRWVVSGGLTANLQMLDEIGKSLVGYGFVWGRYVFQLTVGLHIGFFGYVGAQNGYLLPVLGIDWLITDKWKLNAVMPLDLSLDYIFTKEWTASLGWAAFGGPYRFPWRYKGGKEGFKDGILQFYSSGVDLSLNYDTLNNVRACVGAGYSFGGWAQIKNSHDRHGKYFKYDGAPYALAELDFTF